VQRVHNLAGDQRCEFVRRTPGVEHAHARSLRLLEIVPAVGIELGDGELLGLATMGFLGGDIEEVGDQRGRYQPPYQPSLSTDAVRRGVAIVQLDEGVEHVAVLHHHPTAPQLPQRAPTYAHCVHECDERHPELADEGQTFPHGAGGRVFLRNRVAIGLHLERRLAHEPEPDGDSQRESQRRGGPQEGRVEGQPVPYDHDVVAECGEAVGEGSGLRALARTVEP
jgi:hypothetical protein